MIAQELLDALTKAQNETNLNPIAVWALSKYLHGAWKDGLDSTIRPFGLGKVMSNFFVDLSQHRLPDKITKQTPETESILLKFFGAAEGSLSQYWTQCIEIWGVVLEPYPVYAKDVNKYLNMLLESSLQQKKKTETSAIPRTESPAVPSKAEPPSVPSKAEPPAVSIPEPAAEIIKPASKPSDVTFTSLPRPRKKQESIPVPAVQEKVPGPSAPTAPFENEPEPTVFPKSAYLILQGTRVIPLNQPLITVGRQLDNHIILEDPRVSRAHARIKLVNDHFVIYDLNSTGGTYVNGKRTAESVLYPGDVISLAGVKFIYSHELPAKPGDLKILELGSPFAADRKTAVVHEDEVKPSQRRPDEELPELPKTGPL